MANARGGFVSPLGSRERADRNRFRASSESRPGLDAIDFSAPQVSAPGMSSAWQDEYRQAIGRLNAELNGLDASYQQDKRELREMYQFAETEDEKARIARQLQDLDRRRDAGVEAIEDGYIQAEENIRARAVESGEATEEEVSAVEQRYAQAQDALSEIAGQRGPVEDGPGGLGVAADGGTDLTPWQGLLTSEGAAQAQSTQRMGDITTEDIEFLADTQQSQSEGAQAALWNLAQQQTASAQEAHAQRVADRIQQERMAFAGQAGQLQSDYRNREFGIGDRIAGLHGELGSGMRQQAAQGAQMGMEAQLANADMAMRAQEQGAARDMAMRELAMSRRNSDRDFQLAQDRFNLEEQQVGGGDELGWMEKLEFKQRAGEELEAGNMTYGDFEEAGTPGELLSLIGDYKPRAADAQSIRNRAQATRDAWTPTVGGYTAPGGQRRSTPFSYGRGYGRLFTDEDED